jgi:hypothetical protein
VLLGQIWDAHVHVHHEQALLHGLMGIGVVAIIAKIHRWDESAMFFDGASLGEFPHLSILPTRCMHFLLFMKLNEIPAAFVFAIAMYITVTIPAIQTVVTPVAGVDTRDDQIEAVQVLSAGNTLIMLLLGGILVLQVRSPHV